MRAWLVALAAAGVSFGYAHAEAASPDQGLVAHYSFDEGGGMTVFDRTGGGHDGRLLGARYRHSPRGRALQFDGDNDVVDYGSPARLNLSGDMSLAAWVRMDVDDQRDTQRLIFGDTASLAVNRNFNLRVDAHNQLYFGWGDGKASGRLTADASKLDGEWRHIAVTCDSAKRVATMYVDGEPVARTRMPVPVSATSGRPKKSGAWRRGHAFVGSIDDIRIYRRAIGPDEVRALFGAQAEPFAPVGQADPLDNAGLLARYTFNKGAGDVLADHGPFGIQGKIHGATWVESPWGGALRFDGKDDYVDLGSPEPLAGGGDLTLELWLRCDPRSAPNVPRLKNHRLIIGTHAGLSVDRHFNLRLDDVDNLLFEYHGPDKQSLFTHDSSFLRAGWVHLTIVIESGDRYYVYANGRIVAAQALDQALAPLNKGPIRIGGWGFGHFKGDIDEVRLYGRALTTREIRHAGGPAAAQLPPTMRLNSVGLSVLTKRIEVAADVMDGKGDPACARLRLLDRRAADVVAPLRASLDAPLRNGSGRWTLKRAMPLDAVGPGDYTLRAELLDAHGQCLDAHDMAIRYAQTPSWLNGDVGVTDNVAPPHQPCDARTQGGAVVVRTWGRRHVFGRGPLLEAIDSGGVPLLAAPMRLDATVDGRAAPWSPATPKLTRRTPARVDVEQTVASQDVSVRVGTVMEYDGFMRIDALVKAKRDLSLDALTMTIPLAPKSATLMYDWPVSHSGAVPDDYHQPFRPTLWIGNEQRGLVWAAESDQYWRPADPKRAVEIQRGNGRVLLRLNLIGRPTAMRRGESRPYTFAFQATPVRPVTRTAWDNRYCTALPYGYDMEAVDQKTNSMPTIQYVASMGVRAVHISRWSEIFSYTLPTGREREFRRLVDALHAAKLKAVPYAIGFLLSEFAPEYRDYGADMVVKPRRTFNISTSPPGYEKQRCDFGCVKGPWQDFCVASFARCMDEYGCDGVYLDSTTRPVACTNRAHGCGYVREDGTIAPTYPVFALRRLLKRLYTVVKTRKPDGILDVHVYDSAFAPALSFATGYWNGEQLARGPVLRSLPLDRFRAEFLGRNLGVPAELLHYRIGDFQSCIALGLIHDVPVRGGRGKSLALVSQLWRVRDTFGCNDAAFHGYWENAGLVTVTGDHCYASLWTHPTNGVLAAVANLSRTKQDVRVSLNRPPLGLPTTLAATNAVTGEPIAVHGDAILVPLGAQRSTLIWLRAPKQ